MTKPYRNYINTWRLSNTLLNDEWVIEEIRGEVKKFLELNEKSDTTHLDLWDTMKAILRGKFIAMSAYIRISDRSPIKNLMMHPKPLKKKNKPILKLVEGRK